MGIRRLVGVGIVVAIVLLGVGRANGQTTTTGQILGDVTDPSGGVIGGGKVTLTSDTGTNRETTTSPTGRYVFALLPPGNYHVEVSASGFATAKVDEITVKITEATTVDVRLSLASQKQETITVQAEPPLLQTENPGRGTVIE
ncbi:MAG: carboxypeptidase-like regulatory domain-containing protein, partial [Candidatus Acidiferrum sp.]